MSGQITQDGMFRLDRRDRRDHYKLKAIMVEESIALPFVVPDLFAGFAEGRGLAKASPAELILEFIVRDSVVNIVKSRVKEIRVPRSEIDTVKLKRGLFGAKVRIRVKTMKLLTELPGCENGEVTLHVSRRDRDQAEAFVQILCTAA